METQNNTTNFAPAPQANPKFIACIVACGRSENAKQVVRAWALGLGTCAGLRNIPNQSQSYALKCATAAIKKAGCVTRPNLNRRRMVLCLWDAATGARVEPTLD